MKNVPIKFDREFVQCLPTSMKVMLICSIGFDRYDVEALNERGIILCNTPLLASDQVADTALYHVLNCFRQYTFFEKALRQTSNTSQARLLAANEQIDPATGFPGDQVDYNKPFVLGDQVNSKIVRTPRGHIAGIVGLGAIGQELLKRLNVLGMHVHYCKRKQLTDLERQRMGGIPLTYHPSFESMLPHCDVLIFCVPLNLQTKHMLNSESLLVCKKGVRIVNIGRGSVINELDLVELLKSGQVSFAGLDVFEDEPSVKTEITQRYDISLTPHIGSSTLDNRILSSECCQNNIINVLIDGGEGLTPIK